MTSLLGQLHLWYFINFDTSATSSVAYRHFTLQLHSATANKMLNHYPAQIIIIFSTPFWWLRLINICRTVRSKTDLHMRSRRNISKNATTLLKGNYHVQEIRFFHWVRVSINLLNSVRWKPLQTCRVCVILCLIYLALLLQCSTAGI